MRTTPKLEGENKSGLILERTTCAKCGKNHEGKCISGMAVLY